MRYLKFATQYRNVSNTLERLHTIFKRYNLNPKKLSGTISQFIEDFAQQGYPITLPVTGQVVEKYPGIFQQLLGPQIEFAIHGYFHQDYTLLPKEEKIKWFKKAAQTFRQSHIPFCGFRFPYLRRDFESLSCLSYIPIKYDSSYAFMWPLEDSINGGRKLIMEKMLLQYQPLNPAQLPVLPFRFENFLEIPVSLPDDDILYDRLNLRSQQEIASIWGNILENIYEREELFVLQLHPERYFLLAQALREVVNLAKSLSTVWITSLREIARWWEEKYAVQMDAQWQSRYYTVHLKKTVRVDYELILPEGEHNDFTIVQNPGREDVVFRRFPRIPVIGLSSEVDRSLADFLKNLGFFYEYSKTDRGFAIYFSETPPSGINLQLLEQIKNQLSFPLIRVKNWPRGIRCAMAVTGDIDALTIQDFYSRIYGK